MELLSLNLRLTHRKFVIFKCVQASLKEMCPFVGPMDRQSVGQLVSCSLTRFFVFPKMGEIVKKDSKSLQSFCSNLLLSICLSIFHSQFFFHYLPFTFFLLQYFFSNLSFAIFLLQSFFHNLSLRISSTKILSQSFFQNLSFTISL